MFENHITTPEEINILLPELYYGKATKDLAQHLFTNEMTQLAKGIDFNRQEWNAAIEALQGFSIASFTIDLSLNDLATGWMMRITHHWETCELAHHFFDEQGQFNEKAHNTFFSKVCRLSDKRATSVIFVAHNFWTKNDEFLPIFEEIINS